MKLSIKYKESRGLIKFKKANSKGNAAYQGIKKGLQNIGKEGVDIIRKSAHEHFKDNPKDITRSGGIQYNVNNRLRLEIWTSAPYATIQNYGGTIKTKYSPYLMFQPKGANHLVKVKQVTIKANHFFNIGIDRLSKNINKYMWEDLHKKIGMKK